MSSKRAYRPAPAVKSAIILALHESPESSVAEIAAQIEVPYQSTKRVLTMLEVEGVVEFSDTAPVLDANGDVSRGRPVHQFKLSSSGVKRARRALQAA